MEETEESKQEQPKPKPAKHHKVWTCRKCLVEFENRKNLIEHSKTHLEPPKPNFQFDSKLQEYFCCSCPLHYQTEKEVEEHYHKAHEESYTCEVCQETSKKAYTFAIHMTSHSTNQTLECPLCSYATKRKPCLQNHINRVHYRKFYYTCTTCRKGFNDPVIFKEHNNEHVGVKPFKCVVCLKDFCYSRYMLTHQTRHHTVHIQGVSHKTQCPVCLKVFSKETTLTKHVSKHLKTDNCDSKRHLCDVCGKSFASKDKMKLHYRIHTGEKPFQCRFCPKNFTKRDYLVMHERIHTGEKPYECAHCGRRFNQACSLKIHVRSHTGERPYVCPSCQKGCITRASLNVHMKYCCLSVTPTN